MTDDFVTLEEIEAARDRIAGRVRRTFVSFSTVLSDPTGHPVHLKLEHQQITGSFKLRGATNAVLSLDDAAREAGARALICMSELVPQAKRDGIAAQGAEVRIIGKSQEALSD